jgi:uncharacterized protein with FMN-binding domain
MEENTNPTPEVKQSGSKTLLYVSLIAIALVVYTATSKKDLSSNSKTSTPESTMTQTVNSSNYKDGVYTVKGDYTSPGGAEQIDVKLTVKGNVVSDAEVVSLAERPISKKFQGEFVAGYKEFVVGKKLEEIKITKVSGSSLTPKGFTDALEKIKAQAKS